MNPDINLWQEIPQEIKDAALLLENYFKEKNIDKWALYDVCSRKLVDEAYNNGLNTAISLVKECGEDETIICGLENSKKETPATYFIHE